MSSAIPNRLIEAVDTSLPSLRFNLRAFGDCDVTQMLQLHRSGPRFWEMMPIPLPDVPDQTMTEILELTEPLIGRFVDRDTGELESADWWNTSGRYRRVKREVVVQHLLRGAAFLGSENAIRTFVRWAEGEPFRTTLVATLWMTTISRDTETCEGIRLVQLPHARGHLYRTALSPPPHMVEKDVNLIFGLQDKVVLTVDHYVTPLFRLPSSNSDSVVASWGTQKNPGRFPLKDFCVALSLARNHHITWHLRWATYGSATAFGYSAGSVTSKTGLSRRTGGVEVDQSHLQRAFDIMQEGTTTHRTKLKTAVSRWLKSKEMPRGELDSFIDLRVALEALFMTGGWELRYRLSNRGAWYLGRTGSDRMNIYKDLKKFYSDSSKIIHASTHQISEAERNRLSRAQDICREGILKRLGSDEEPDWDRVTLDLGSP